MHSLSFLGSIARWRYAALAREAEAARIARDVEHEELSLCLPGGWCLIRYRTA